MTVLIPQAALRPPADRRGPIGRPRTTWLRIGLIDDDLQSLNFGSTRIGGMARDRDVLASGHLSSARQRVTMEFASKEVGPKSCYNEMYFGGLMIDY